MPPNDIMGECHGEDCEKVVPSHELTQIREGGEIMLLCSSCLTKHCDHPNEARDETPQGRPYCTLCNKVLEPRDMSEQATQTTLGGFSA